MATAEPEPHPDAPAWARDGTRVTAFLRGVIVALGTPGAILLFASTGFGALARDGGLTLAAALFLCATLYALPAQVVLVDALTHVAALPAAAFAASLTGIRLLPMAASLLPVVRDGRSPRWLYLVAIHYVAITTWIEGHRRLPLLPERLRLFHYLGIGTGTLVMTLTGTSIGYALQGRVAGPIAAGLLLMTPLYFFLSLVGAARAKSDWIAIALGCLIGPPLYLLVPGFDLLIAGLAGGTIAYLVGRGRRRGAT